MDTSWLVGKTIKAVRTYATEPVHPAWVNELTTPIATSAAFLEFESGEFAQISPCEVRIENETYPSLGLELELFSSDPSQFPLLPCAADFVPFLVSNVEESDPLGEGATSQIHLIGGRERGVVFRHIMPPMTLGILVAAPMPST